MKKLSLVIPMYYEEEVAQTCYDRVKENLDKIKDNYNYEIVFVNDGSKDKTLSILKDIAKKDKNVKVVSFSRNFGHQVAVTAGLKYVTGDAVLIMDADLQDPPEVIPDMLKKWEEGYEVIYGKRKSREGESAFKLLTASAFYSFLNKMSDTEIPKDTGDFRLVDKSVIEVINSLPEHNKFLRGLFSWVGFNQYAFEYERKERVAGKTKYPLKKMLKLAGDGIIGFSKKPLKMIYKMAFFSLFLFVAVIVASIVIHVNNWQNVIMPGWTTIMLAITFLSSLILFALGFIGEYIMRIYDETRQRPQYIVKETDNVDKK